MNNLKQESKRLGGFFDIDNKEIEVKELESKTFENNFWENQENAQKILQQITRFKTDIQSWTKLADELENNFEIYKLAIEEDDQKLILELDETFENIDKDIEKLNLQLKLNGRFDGNNAIVILHSGAGGTEACDWVDMMLRMYIRWSESKGYKTEILDILPGEEAGIKSVVFMVKGLYSYGYLKSEIGVHRLVRISPFDANKRRHTSFASCDVIPEISDDINIKIDDKDLRIDTYRASGAGGQHVNTTDSAIRITHLPSGVVVQCQNERSQHKNKSAAMGLLKARLFELEEEKRRKQTEKHYDDKGAIGWGNQIRSYVFCPYTLVKDHRTNFEIGNVQAVLDGEIDGFINAFLNRKMI